MPDPKIAGVLLAGGQSRRMGGGDKCLRALGDKTILHHIIARARPQVSTLVLNANGDPARFAGFGLPVTPDTVEGFAGPLAGVLAGFDWVAEHAPECKWLTSFATDAPFLPENLVVQMLAAVREEKADLACARSDGRDHPVFGLWPLSLREALRTAMLEEEMRKVDRWTGRYTLAVAEFAVDGIDPFFNANRPEDLDTADRWIGSRIP
ncbi:MAG: molybdenum cofactor guanylyltransferase MobA [Alphaproteobacteria bacterium]|jgi:molybdenum cofactor guanylyltransferase|nr:molybdenum cofactor guanylyltransferase MobA [Alphaproteobacteria bacterium]